SFTRWYHDAGGNWISNTGIEGASAAGQISNEHYDTPTGLADIAGPRYGVFWLFIHFDSDLHVVYGTGNYKLAQAEMAVVPVLPEAVRDFSTLAAKIIVGSADPNFTSIVSAYETLFPVSTPPNHDDLGGIVTDNHHARYTNAEAIAAAKTVKLDDFATPDDNTDLDFSTLKHGLVPKGTNVGDYLKDNGTWATVIAGKSIATGSYTGDGTDDRQITTGFKCSMVVIYRDTARNAIIIPSKAFAIDDA
ncbi:unnamed protein product, partial [marine sediment metagenome]